MGVDAGDFDNDGDEDLFMTELTGEGSNLYVNDGSGVFEDRRARASGLGPASLALHRLRHRLVRLRQRRLARHPDGQRRGAGDRGAAAGERSVSAASAEAAVPQPRRRPVRGCDRAGRRGVRSCRRSAAARRSATSTTTATSTSSSATTTGPLRLLVNKVGNRNHWLGLRLIGGLRRV